MYDFIVQNITYVFLGGVLQRPLPVGLSVMRRTDGGAMLRAKSFRRLGTMKS